MWIVHRGEEIVLRGGDRIEWDFAPADDSSESMPISARVMHGDGSTRWLVRAMICEDPLRDKLMDILKDVASAAGVPMAKGIGGAE